MKPSTLIVLLILLTVTMFAIGGGLMVHAVNTNSDPFMAASFAIFIIFGLVLAYACTAAHEEMNPHRVTKTCDALIDGETYETVNSGTLFGISVYEVKRTGEEAFWLECGDPHPPKNGYWMFRRWRSHFQDKLEFEPVASSQINGNPVPA